MDTMPVEQFAALRALGLPHGFTGRVAGLDVDADREAALERLRGFHLAAKDELVSVKIPLVTVEQIHGAQLAIVKKGDGSTTPRVEREGKDGIITDRRDICLGIYVADCCAVYLADPVVGAIGLVHAGKKGAELGIVAAAIEALSAHFGSDPKDLTVQLSPCIRPPWYEIAFSEQIIAQCRDHGVGQVHDCGICTASHPEKYYSYRREKGRTGRMLAMLAQPADRL